MEPGLLTDHPRAADLWIIGCAVVLSKGAVVVGAKSRDEEQAVLPAGFLLHVHADRCVGQIGLESVARRAAAHGGDWSRRECRAGCRDRARLRAVVLETDRRR